MFLWLAMLAIVLPLSAQNKAAMLQLTGSDQSTAETAALNWFKDNNKGDVITSLDNLNSYTVLWVMIDRIGRNQNDYPAPLNSNIEKLKTWVKNGGNLIVTNQATDLVSTLGRVENFTPTVYGNGGGGNNTDTWGINAVTNDAKGHAIYEGLTTETLNGNQAFPLIGSCNKWDHNSMWELSRFSYSNQANFELQANAKCLGTWQQNTDLNIPAIIEFLPSGEYKGTILANGIAAFDWQASARKDNLTKLADNMIAYMLGKSSAGGGTTTDPTDPEVTVGTKVGMLKIESGISSTEQKAINWFSTKYTAENVITSLDNLSDYKVLWVMIDRPGLTQGVSNLPLSTEQIAKLRAWVKSGGNLLVTNHATQLVQAIGRCDKAIGEYNSKSTQNNNDDIWGINAIDASNHEIYKNLSKINSWFPLIKPGMKWDHNCIWKDVNQTSFESTYTAKCLGTWQQNNDFGWTAVAEFLPTDVYEGRVLACGIAAFDWDATAYKKNFVNFAANMLSYLNTGYADPNPETVPQPQDGVIAKFDLSLSSTNQVTDGATQEVYNVNHRLDAYETVGAKGKCLRFDGYSNYIASDINTDNMATKKLTFSLWCAPQAYPSITGMDASGEEWTNIAGNFSNNTGVAFRITNRGKYAFVCNVGGTLIECKATERMPCSVWNHLVATVDTEAGEVKFYNNGTLVASKTGLSGDIDTGNSTFVIGKGVETVGSSCIMNTFCGLIDEVELYNGLQSSLITDNTPENAVDMNYDIERRYGNNILRPKFHGMPDGNWTNETHGLIYYGGKYHVFFQKNANGPIMCHQQWGHITSDNLYNWKEEKLALMPLEDYEAKGTWSGCVFTDDAFNDGKPVIGYTSVDFAKASIPTAFSIDDNLLDWTKQGQAIAASPDGCADFRDCYYFTANGNKYMIVGTGKNNVGATTLHKYNNGSWEFQGSFFEGTDASAHGTYWEMPTITKMDEAGNYLFTCTPLGTSVGVKVIYWIGTINNDGTFNAVSGPFDFEMAGTSKDGYGLLSPSICKTNDGKTICLGIVPDKVDGAKNAEWGWAHNYSLPRELSLSADKKTLIQKPYAGLTGMRSTVGNYSAENVTLNNNSAQPLGDVKGRQIEFIGEFTVNNNVEQGFRFLKNGNNYASLSYKDGKLTLDISNMQKVDNVTNYNSYVSDLTIADGQTLKLHVYLDGSIADVFVNDKDAFSVRLFPTDVDAVEVEAFSTGNTTVSSLKGWNLVKTPSATEDITTNVTGTASHVSTKALDFSGSGLKAYVATSVTSSTVVLQEVATVPAGTAFVVKGNPSTTYKVDVTDDFTLNVDNLFKGSTTESYSVKEGEKVYALSNITGSFKKVKEGVNIPSGKAYLIVVETMKSNDTLILDFGDGSTGISENNTSVIDSTPRKYIKNNRVVIFKDGKEYNVAGELVQ